MDKFVELGNSEFGFAGQYGTGKRKQRTDEEGPNNGKVYFPEVLPEKRDHNCADSLIEKKVPKNGTFFSITVDFFPLAEITGFGGFYPLIAFSGVWETERRLFARS